MASSQPPFFGLCRSPSPVQKVQTFMGSVRAQSSSGDKGKSAGMVDANLNVLRRRIDEVRKQERLKELSCSGDVGWCYQAGYDHKPKRAAKLSEFLELTGLVAGTFGFTLLSGTLFLCLVSLVVHLNH